MSQDQLERPSLQGLLQAWPAMQPVLALSADERLCEDIAKCCLIAMRADAESFAGILAPVTAAAVQCFTAPGGHSFGGVLCQGLQLYGQSVTLRTCLLQGVRGVLQLPAVFQLGHLKAGDQCPELAQASISVGAKSLHAAQQHGWTPVPVLHHPFKPGPKPHARALSTCLLLIRIIWIISSRLEKVGRDSNRTWA